MKLAGRIRTISYLKAHAAEIVRTLGDRGETLVITQNGEVKVVLQDIDSHDTGLATWAALLPASSRAFRWAFDLSHSLPLTAI